MGAGGIAYAWELEPSWVEISQVSLKLPRLGKAFDGFRVVQVSDIHMGGWMNAQHFSSVMKLALAQGADLLALTGDFVNSQRDPKAVARAIADVSEGFNTLGEVPRVGVLGNHDYSTNSFEIRKMMGSHQILDLTNSVHTLHTRGRFPAHCGSG